MRRHLQDLFYQQGVQSLPEPYSPPSPPGCLQLADLENYVDLNFTGFRKILKKHDKEVDTVSGGGAARPWTPPTPHPPPPHTHTGRGSMRSRTKHDKEVDTVSGGGAARGLQGEPGRCPHQLLSPDPTLRALCCRAGFCSPPPPHTHTLRPGA
jgi:hypothetical protein